MQSRRTDLADLSYFLEIAKHRNFRRASVELGVSPSAMSHALRSLEERLGVRLLNRTSRSVTLTAAGEALQGATLDPFDQITRAFDVVNAFRDAPRGRIRISMENDAADFLVAPILPEFIERYPDVELEISVNNRMIDVTEGGFDAGIRYGGAVPEDMVIQRLSADFRWRVVAAPAYLERYGTPVDPDDLQHHRALRFKLGDDRIYRWEFERGDEEVLIEVPGTVTVDNSRVALSAARRGSVLAYVPDFMVAGEVREGTLTTVLDDWAPLGPGFHVYYTSRRQVPTGLRSFIDLVRQLRPLGF
jgi:DNA-binding transcriptional LysR family regulator